MQAYTYITKNLKKIEKTDPLFSNCIYELLEIVGQMMPDSFEYIMEDLTVWLEENSKKGDLKK